MSESNNESTLRRLAEQRLPDEQESSDFNAPNEAERLPHELHVHQIELEMQNAELRRSQLALAAMRDCYLDLYDFAPVGYLTIDAEGRILQTNFTFADLLGVDRSELVHKPFAQYIAPQSQDALHLLRQRLPGSVTRQTAEILLQRADGEQCWVQIDATSAVRRSSECAAPEVPIFRVTITDIHARKTAEAARDRYAAELDAIFSAIPDGLAICDPTGKVLRVNDCAAKLLGYSAAHREMSYTERVGVIRIAHADGTSYAIEEMPTARALRGETTHGAVMQFHHEERTYWVVSSAAPVMTPDGRFLGTVATYNDITAHHDLQDRQLLLLHLVSHDLRTPLQIIAWYAAVSADMAKELGVDETFSTGLSAILRGVKWMTGMIEDLTELARVEGGQFRLQRESVDLAAYLPDFLQRSASVFDVSRVRVKIAAEVWPVSADRNRLDRIVSNLLSNALKYSDRDTPILVRVLMRSGEVVVSVTDKGRGIMPDDIENLFQRFYRAKGERRAEGIGLGLYITRKLVEAHRLPTATGTAKAGGRIWVESQVGKGSTFYFTLPTA